MNNTEKTEEELIYKEMRKKEFFIDSIIYIVKFLIGFLFCLLISMPFLLVLHCFYIEKYGTFFTIRELDYCILILVNLIFWLKIRFTK